MAAAKALLVAAAAAAAVADAANPLGGKTPADYVPGMADANLHYFDGKFSMWATHDFSVNNTGFTMKDWWIWSSPDLVEWTKEAVVSPEKSLPWDTQENECWATDAAFVGGKYFFYVSAGGGEVGVMSAPSLKGPWTDPLGKPLLSSAFGKAQNPPTTFRDPCVFQDPDTKESYIVAGVFTYYITKLKPDMITLAETPQLVNFSTHTYGPCGDGKTADQPFLHKNGDTYYLSWGCFYATSKSVYGPYAMQGAVIDTAKIAPAYQCDGQPGQCGNKATDAPDAAERRLRASGTESDLARADALAQYRGVGAGPTPWFLKEDYTDRHGSFLSHGKQWYYVSNDRSHSKDVGHEGVFRDTVICYIHFRANNTMEACTIDATGVGQYDASSPDSVVEAENFFELRGPGDKLDLIAEGDDDGDVGFAVGGLRAGSELHYPNIELPAEAAAAATHSGAHFLELELTLYLATAAALAPGSSSTVLASSANGRLLGSVAITSTGSWTAYRPLRMTLAVPRSELDADGQLDLVLGVDASMGVQQEGGELARLKHFTLQY